MNVLPAVLLHLFVSSDRLCQLSTLFCGLHIVIALHNRSFMTNCLSIESLQTSICHDIRIQHTTGTFRDRCVSIDQVLTQKSEPLERSDLIFALSTTHTGLTTKGGNSHINGNSQQQVAALLYCICCEALCLPHPNPRRHRAPFPRWKWRPVGPVARARPRALIRAAPLAPPCRSGGAPPSCSRDSPSRGRGASRG